MGVVAAAVFMWCLLVFVATVRVAFTRSNFDRQLVLGRNQRTRKVFVVGAVGIVGKVEVEKIRPASFMLFQIQITSHFICAHSVRAILERDEHVGGVLIRLVNR